MQYLTDINFDPHKLRSARESRELSQAGVAKTLGVSRQRLHAWESGLNTPDPTMLARLCRIYGVELSDLTGEAVAA